MMVGERYLSLSLYIYIYIDIDIEQAVAGCTESDVALPPVRGDFDALCRVVLGLAKPPHVCVRGGPITVSIDRLLYQ